MMEWQPIETAEAIKYPIEGRSKSFRKKILLWVDGTFYTGNWNEEPFHVKPRPHWDFDHPFGKRWVRENQPTHWMEIIPPEDATKENETV